ncbi:MAG: hypothetical protein K2K85_03630 [Clostridia bacterium]|nr:hypothetical protein [Clostridia bacterium]
MKTIVKDLNKRAICTNKGTEFTSQSLQQALRNKKLYNILLLFFKNLI